MITVNRLCIDIVKHLIDTFKLNAVPDFPVSGVGIEYLELISVIVDYCERTVGNEVDLTNCRIVLVPQSRLDLVLFALVHIGKLCRRNRRTEQESLNLFAAYFTQEVVLLLSFNTLRKGSYLHFLCH